MISHRALLGPAFLCDRHFLVVVISDLFLNKCSMSQQTPQPGAQVHLLFTPTAKIGEGARQGSTVQDFLRGPPYMGRSPSATPGAGTGGRGARDRTPPSRRRSLTPTSSVARDTPPPPPMDSLLDSPATALGPSLAGWGRSGEADAAAEDISVSTSPVMAARAAQQQFAQQRELARASRALEQYEDTWVTGEWEMARVQRLGIASCVR